MQINIDPKKEQILKKLLKANDIKPIIEKVVSDWISFTIDTKYRPIKSDDDILIDLNK
jgi:hypothetical protein